MKKEIVQYAKGKFMHFDGKEREFTVCMVSISPDNYNDLAYESDDKEHPNYLFTNHSTKGYTVAFDCLALMSTDVANALLKNFVDRVSNDPSLAIQSYEEQKECYDLKNNN